MRTSIATVSISGSLEGKLRAVAEAGFDEAVRRIPELRRGTYLHRGHCTRESLARAFGLGYTPLLATGGTGE
jgi:hypothetical protein